MKNYVWMVEEKVWIRNCGYFFVPVNMYSSRKRAREESDFGGKRGMTRVVKYVRSA